MRYVILLGLAGAALSLSACGGTSSPGSGGSTSPSDAAASNSQGLQFAHCMRAHGVANYPDPTNGKFDLRIQQSPNSTSVNGVEVNGPTFRAALNDCRSYLPNGGHPTAAQTARARTQALAMSRCMRSHGVPNFPDPQFRSTPGGGIGVQIGGAGIEPNSPAFQNAAKQCGSIFGGKGPEVAKAPG